MSKTTIAPLPPVSDIQNGMIGYTLKLQTEVLFFS
jgi:hypothetical protein